MKGGLRVWPPILVALAVAGPPVFDGKADWLWSDAPRHLMNGVLLHDVLRDPARVFDLGLVTFAERYYAQYPALSIGHHPPLIALALVPAFSIFGVTLAAAQVTMLAFFLLATVLIYGVAARQYDDETAMWAALLCASHPLVGGFARTTMTELPAMAIVLASVLAAMRFRDSGQVRDYVALVVLALLTLVARQTAIFVWPVYAWIARGARPLPGARRTIAVWTGAALAGMALLAAATVWYSPFNVDVVVDVLRRTSLEAWASAAAAIATGLPGLPLLVVALTAVIIAATRRDARAAMPVVWAGTVVAGAVLATGDIESVRYAVLAVPALCLIAASLVNGRRFRLAASAALAVVVAAQGWTTATAAPRRTDAYERAAAYVVDRIGAGSSTVMYAAAVDTGYFVFFVRALDPHGRIVTLRADKLLTTSLMTRSSARDRVASAVEVYPMLDRYATRFVVVETGATGSAVLDQLQRELEGSRFVERLRLPVEGDSRAVVVYEFPESPPEPAPDAELDLDLPLVNREIRVRLADLRPW